MQPRGSDLSPARSEKGGLSFVELVGSGFRLICFLSYPWFPHPYRYFSPVCPPKGQVGGLGHEILLVPWEFLKDPVLFTLVLSPLCPLLCAVMASEPPHSIWQCEELKASSLGFVERAAVLLICCQRARKHRQPGGVGREECPMVSPSEPRFLEWPPFSLPLFLK